MRALTPPTLRHETASSNSRCAELGECPSAMSQGARFRSTPRTFSPRLSPQRLCRQDFHPPIRREAQPPLAIARFLVQRKAAVHLIHAGVALGQEEIRLPQLLGCA